MLATGVSPWVQTSTFRIAPAGRHSMQVSCYVAPTVLRLDRSVNHGLTPVATFFRRSAANSDFLCKAPVAGTAG